MVLRASGGTAGSIPVRFRQISTSRRRVLEAVEEPGISTYRRHLTAAIDRISDWVWQRESGV